MKTRIALAGLALLATPATSTAAADRPPSHAAAEDTGVVASANELSMQLDALLSRNAPVLALRKPPLAALFRRAFDLDAIRAMPNDLLVVTDALQALTAAYGALHRFALGRPEDTARMLLVQDEIVTATIVFLLAAKRTYPAIGPLLIDSDQTVDSKRATVREMHRGIALMMDGALSLQADVALAPATRTRLIAGIVEELAAMAEAMGPADRARMRALILRFAAKAAPGDRATLEQAAHLFERTDCGTLCRLSD